MEKLQRPGKKFDYILRLILHWMERVIAVITVLGLTGALILECSHMLKDMGYYADITHLLHNLLGIVVGLEFVRMLLDTTPANIIEVLVVAITRHVVLSHEDPWSNLVSILCVACLFAIRRYLIRPDELKEEIVDE